MLGASPTCDQVSIKDASGDLGIRVRHATINFFYSAKLYRGAFPVSAFCAEVAKVKSQRRAGADAMKFVQSS